MVFTHAFFQIQCSKSKIRVGVMLQSMDHHLNNNACACEWALVALNPIESSPCVSWLT